MRRKIINNSLFKLKLFYPKKKKKQFNYISIFWILRNFIIAKYLRNFQYSRKNKFNFIKIKKIFQKIFIYLNKTKQLNLKNLKKNPKFFLKKNTHILSNILFLSLIIQFF